MNRSTDSAVTMFMRRLAYTFVMMNCISTLHQTTSNNPFGLPGCMAVPDNYQVAAVPPMGWNSLYAHYLDVSEDVMKDAADHLVQLGLRDLGYRHVNIDDCWMATQRDPITNKLQANPKTFPNGIASLAKYMHDRQMLLGIYSSAGTMTCTKFPGSVHYETLDAQTFADWGVDYVKYDNCYGDGTPDVVRHSKMRDALLATNRPMFFSVCNGGENDIWRWASAVGHAWRSTVDIQRHWKSIYQNYWNNQRQIESTLYNKFTHSWADPDMLQMGSGEGPELPLAEQRSQFGLWVLAKAPLILSTNLARLANHSLEIVSKTNLIAIHQDPHYPPAMCNVGCRRLEHNGDGYNATWPLPYSILSTTNVLDDARTTEVTVAIVVNWSDDNQTLTNLTIYAHDIGVVPLPNSKLTVTDLWTGSVVMKMVMGGSSCRNGKKVKGNNDPPIPFVIPTLAPHDNIIYRFEISNAAADDLDQDIDCTGGNANDKDDNGAAVSTSQF